MHHKYAHPQNFAWLIYFLSLIVVNRGQMRAAVSVLIGMPEMWRVSTAMPWSVGRSSFTLWWAHRAPPSARIWPSCSYRQGSWGGTVTAVIKYFKQSRSNKKGWQNVLDVLSQWTWWGAMYHISRVSVSAAGHGLSAVVLHPAVPQNRTGLWSLDICS